MATKGKGSIIEGLQIVWLIEQSGIPATDTISPAIASPTLS